MRDTAEKNILMAMLNFYQMIFHKCKGNLETIVSDKIFKLELGNYMM